MKKKACVVFVAEMKMQAEEICEQLQDLDYEVCLSEAALDDAVAAQQGVGVVSPEIEACLTGADLKIFLIPAADVPSGLLNGADLAARMPGRLVAVCAAGAVAPEIFDKVAKSVLKIDNPDLLEGITSKDLHESKDGAVKPPRNPKRVKCQ